MLSRESSGWAVTLGALLLGLAVATFMLGNRPRPAPDLTLVPSQEKTFGGYRCTEDCSGHEAGYEWARREGVDYADECPDRARSFREGCLAYVQAEDDLQSAFVSGP